MKNVVYICDVMWMCFTWQWIIRGKARQGLCGLSTGKRLNWMERYNEKRWKAFLGIFFAKINLINKQKCNLILSILISLTFDNVHTHTYIYCTYINKIYRENEPRVFFVMQNKNVQSFVKWWSNFFDKKFEYAKKNVK